MESISRSNSSVSSIKEKTVKLTAQFAAVLVIGFAIVVAILALIGWAYRMPVGTGLFAIFICLGLLGLIIGWGLRGFPPFLNKL